MPRYEFECKHCKKAFIVSVSIADRDKVKCPECGTKSIKQKFSSISIGGSQGCGSSCSGQSSG